MKLNARSATAADFDASAQKHANAFWFWLVTAVGIYYFIGWWAVFPALGAGWSAVSRVVTTIQAKKLRQGTYGISNPNNGVVGCKAPDPDSKESLEEKMRQVMTVINAYGAFLMSEKAPAPGCIADTSKLPFPKALLKAALMVGIRTSNSPEATTILAHGYYQLANFQDGVGEIDVGIDATRLDMRSSDLARQVLEQAERHDQFSAKSEAEILQLHEDMRKAGVEVA
jgi:hypothetical protein